MPLALALSVFWGPMAVAMIGGFPISTVATLLVVLALHGLALRRSYTVQKMIGVQASQAILCHRHSW